MRSEFAANVSVRVHSTFVQPAHVALKVAPVTGKRGAVAYPLGEQIADTVRAHGLRWAASYYCAKGVPEAEFLLLARGAGVLQ